MAASPLAAALLGESGGGAAGFTDPNVAAALPDIQLGQSLTQGSLSTAPASPWQALARVAQAAAGSYIQKGAQNDLAKAYAHTADNMAQIFPQGTPIGNMLRSNDPTVRMMGLQQAGKAAIIGQEGYNLEPGAERKVGPITIGTNEGPQSPEGKKVRDAAALAAGSNGPAANAITSTISKEGQIGETGVPAPAVPLNVPRFGGMNSVAGYGPGGPASPSAAPQAGGATPQRPAGVPLTAPSVGPAAAPGTPIQNAGVPTTAPNFAERFAASAPQSVAPTAVSTAPAPTAPIAKAPATAVPATPLQGPVSTADQIANSKGAQKNAEITGEANAKYYDSLHRGLAGSAMIAAQQKQNIDMLRQVAASPNFTPGAGSDAALALQRTAAQLGIKTEGAAPREIFNQVAARVLADQMSGIKSMASETGEAGGRIFKPMLDLEEKANITPEDSAAGIKAKLDLLDRSGDLMMKWGNMADDYMKAHGKLDPGFDKTLRGEIGNARIPNIVPGPAAKSPAATAPAAPSATATPPVPNARQAPDGNWYVPDPARAGKYLRVNT